MIIVDDKSLRVFRMRFYTSQEDAINGVNENFKNFTKVKPDFQTYEMCLDVVSKWGLTIIFVKGDYRTLELCLAAVKQNNDAIKYVPAEFLERCRQEITTDGQILHIENLSSLPSAYSFSDFVDPYTLDSLIEGETYAFIVENDKWYLAGSYSMFQDMISTRYRRSNLSSLFVPFKNNLVQTSQLVWVKY